MKPALLIGALMASAMLSACSGGNYGNNTQVIDVPVSEGAYQMLCGQIAQSADPVKARYGCDGI